MTVRRVFLIGNIPRKNFPKILRHPHISKGAFPLGPPRPTSAHFSIRSVHFSSHTVHLRLISACFGPLSEKILTRFCLTPVFSETNLPNFQNNLGREKVSGKIWREFWAGLKAYWRLAQGGVVSFRLVSGGWACFPSLCPSVGLSRAGCPPTWIFSANMDF